jgi:hypothetical protein
MFNKGKSNKINEDVDYDALIETNNGKGYTEDENLNAIIRFKWFVHKLRAKETKHLGEMKAFKQDNPTLITKEIESYIETSEKNLKHYEERIVHYEDFISKELLKLK